MRTQAVRNEVGRLIRRTPFHPFVIGLENGDSVLIAHPENIAFDPGTNGSSDGSTDFYVITGIRRVYGTFEAISTVSLLDTGGRVTE